jgi:hypothetical protein
VHPLEVAYSRSVELFRRALDDGRQYDVIAIGSSLTKNGFDPALFETLTGLSALNAGLAGNGTTDRILRALRLVLEKKYPRLIIYGIESFSLGIAPGPGPLDDTPKDQIVNIFELHRVRSAMFNWAHSILKGGSLTVPANMPDLLKEHFQHFDGAVLHPDGWVEVRATANPSLPPVNPDVPFRADQIENLQAIAELARAHGATLILVQMPEYVSVLRAFDGRYKRFQALISKFAKENNILYIDFSGDPAFPFGDAAVFSDINHLNSKGAAIYIKLLAARVRGYRSQ